MAPSSFLATRVLKQLALDEGDKYPRAAEVIQRDFYVDDLITGTPTVEEAIDLRREVSNLLHSGGFHITKWSSNTESILSTVPETERATQSLQNLEEADTVKTLGLH
jgi:hypothetical protein